MTSDGRRPKRVADAIREIVADALVHKLGDPRLESVVITEVQVTNDLQVAQIRVRRLVGDDDPAARRQTLRALGRAAVRLRKLIGPQLRLRRCPELRFEYDTGQDAALRVEELLQEIAREPHARDE